MTKAINVANLQLIASGIKVSVKIKKPKLRIYPELLIIYSLNIEYLHFKMIDPL